MEKQPDKAERSSLRVYVRSLFWRARSGYDLGRHRWGSRKSKGSSRENQSLGSTNHDDSRCEPRSARADAIRSYRALKYSIDFAHHST